RECQSLLLAAGHHPGEATGTALDPAIGSRGGRPRHYVRGRFGEPVELGHRPRGTWPKRAAVAHFADFGAARVTEPVRIPESFGGRQRRCRSPQPDVDGFPH
ncbi:MAG TPA: hypothetical protein VIJ07_07090, partial [Dermatophilaceae bacterium]